MTRQFFDLLDRCGDPVDALYILGDLFEMWIGDDDDTPFHRDVIQALRHTTDRGVKIYFMYGNRDFLIGKKFLTATGCVLLPDEYRIQLYGTPVLLMHGDTLCTRDLAYLKARQRAQNPVWQTLFLWLPLWLRRKIASHFRMRSERYTKSTATEIMDVTQEEVERVMKKHSVNQLIHGHTHRPARHDFIFDNQSATRYVLAPWHECGSVLISSDQGMKSASYPEW